MGKEITDTELLDWLEKQNKKSAYTGLCIFRWSTTGRGWRLHETSASGASTSVRHSIMLAMERQEGMDTKKEGS